MNADVPGCGLGGCDATASSLSECAAACNRDHRCNSFNYELDPKSSGWGWHRCYKYEEHSAPGYYAPGAHGQIFCSDRVQQVPPSPPLPPTTPLSPTYDVEFVVAVCNEADVFGRVDSLRARFGTSIRTGATFYCKCARHARCNVFLPNVGRESHSHLSHIVRHYDTLSTVTIFLNSGFASNAFSSWFKTRIVEQTVDSVVILPNPHASPAASWMAAHFFSDGAESFKMWDCPVEGGGCTGFADPSTAPPSEYKAAGQRCSADRRSYCADQSRRCRVCMSFSFLQCGNKCMCDDFSAWDHCSWSGGSSENRNTGANGRLVVPNPRNLASWACQHWGVSPSVLERCHWQWTGTFAVGVGNIRARPRASYQNVVTQLAVAGQTGGLAGHFMERLWRSIFLCSLGGNCVRDVGRTTDPGVLVQRGQVSIG